MAKRARASANAAAECIPAGDGELCHWLDNFAIKVAASPAESNVPPHVANHLLDLATAYISAYRIATDPATRSEATIALKDAAREGALRDFRVYAAQVISDPLIPPETKRSLGLVPPATDPHESAME